MSPFGMALPHSKTLARPPCAPEPPSGFGVRRPCGAFRNDLDLRSGTASTHHLVVPKAGQGSRTPKRWRDHHVPPNLRQVLECAAPAALSETISTFGVGQLRLTTSSFRKRDTNRSRARGPSASHRKRACPANACRRTRQPSSLP